MTDPLVDELLVARQGDPKLRELTWRVITGTVTDSTVDPPTVSTDGSSSIATPVLGNATVLDGDPVLILSAKGTRIILGKAGRQSGWEHITSGSVSAQSSWSITIPSSTFAQVRIVHQGAVASGVGVGLFARVNGDSTAGLHAYTQSVTVSDAVTTSVNGSATSWVVGTLGVNQGCVSELLMTRTDISASFPFKATATEVHATEANCRHQMTGGQLTANRTCRRDDDH